MKTRLTVIVWKGLRGGWMQGYVDVAGDRHVDMNITVYYDNGYQDTVRLDDRNMRYMHGNRWYMLDEMIAVRVLLGFSH